MYMNPQNTHVSKKWLVTLTALAGLTAGARPAAATITTATTPSGVTITVNTTGAYQVSQGSPTWTFAGNVGSAISGVASTTGSDNNGAYHQIAFTFTASVSRSASIRAYDTKTSVLFTTTYLASASNANPFPSFTSYPSTPYHLSYGNTFGKYNFSSLFSDSPWLFFDNSARTFIVSPAKNFMIASDTKNSSTGALSFGINSGVGTLPANFSHQTWLVVGQGINSTYDVWGNCMTKNSGKTRVANDSTVVLNNLGYWTDNGAAYYYKYDSSLGYEGTLLAIRDEFKQNGFPLGYMQLDSWFYPKGSTQDWTLVNSGQYQYVAAPALFPDGLPSFHANLGMPLVTHARWIDPSSPYRSQYTMSNNVSVDPAYWSNIIGYIKNSGVIGYEQDWLDIKALPTMNLNDPPAFMNDMATACTNNGLEMQYCMPLARHYLQGSLYNNLHTMRVCDDIFGTGHFDDFLYDSKLTLSLGAFGWTDVIQSNQNKSLLVQVLSCGPVGVGDPLGGENFSVLAHSVRSDGVIVKPDVAAVPLDSTYISDAQSLSQPMVAAARSDHTGVSEAYVFAYARDAVNTIATFSPALAGISGDTIVYDWSWSSGTYIASGNTCGRPVDTSGSLLLTAPVGTSGIAFFGDMNKYASGGRKRISQLSDNGTVSATVAFGTGETSVTIKGWSPTQPTVTASVGAVGSVTYDAGTGIFSVPVTPGSSSTAQISITRTAGTQTTIKYEAEALSIIASTPTARNGGDNNMSNNNGAFLDATAAGNLVTYNVHVPEARTYDVQIATKDQSNRGMFQVAVASSPTGSYTNHGAVQDEYAASSTYTMHDIGTITFGTAGDKSFRFTVTGKNAASSGFGLAIDSITLIAE